jgi:hypothetical protein
MTSWRSCAADHHDVDIADDLAINDGVRHADSFLPETINS